MQTTPAQPLWKRLLRALLTALLAALLIAVFYVAVIMGHPQEDGASVIEARMDQPLQGRMEAPLLITDDSGLDALLAEFPAPVLQPLYGSALTFVRGTCEEAAFEDGFGRIVTLVYHTDSGEEMTLTNIYPARALSLLEKGDYTLRGTAGPTLATMRSVRMENDAGVRLHAQGTDALYAITVPHMDEAALRQLTGTLQLFGGK